MDDLIINIYDEDADVSMETCKAYFNMLYKKESNKRSDVMMKKIINVARRKLDLIPCFVESALPISDFLNDFEEMFKLLTNLSSNEQQRIFLLIILECVLQKLIGKSSIMRNNSKIRIILKFNDKSSLIKQFFF